MAGGSDRGIIFIGTIGELHAMLPSGPVRRQVRRAGAQACRRSVPQTHVGCNVTLVIGLLSHSGCSARARACSISTSDRQNGAWTVRPMKRTRSRTGAGMSPSRVPKAAGERRRQVNCHPPSPGRPMSRRKRIPCLGAAIGSRAYRVDEELP